MGYGSREVLDNSRSGDSGTRSDLRGCNRGPDSILSISEDMVYVRMLINRMETMCALDYYGDQDAGVS